MRALKSTYRGTAPLNLSAAVNVGTGQVQTKIAAYKKREDFQIFLDGVITDQPPNRSTSGKPY